MQLTVAVPDRVGAPRAATATWSFDSRYESTSQPVRVNWGDGSADVPVAAGTLTAAKTYAADGIYDVYVWGNEVKMHYTLHVGKTAGMGLVYDSDKVDSFMSDRWARYRARDAQVTKGKSRLGTPKQKLRRVAK